MWERKEGQTCFSSFFGFFPRPLCSLESMKHQWFQEIRVLDMAWRVRLNRQVPFQKPWRWKMQKTILPALCFCETIRSISQKNKKSNYDDKNCKKKLLRPCFIIETIGSISQKNKKKLFIPNIAKGTTDPRVEFLSRVQTQILIKFHLQNLDQASSSKSQPNISLSMKLKLQNLDQT